MAIANQGIMEGHGKFCDCSLAKDLQNGSVEKDPGCDAYILQHMEVICMYGVVAIILGSRLGSEDVYFDLQKGVAISTEVSSQVPKGEMEAGILM